MQEDSVVTRGVNLKKLSEKYAFLIVLLILTPLVFLFLGIVAMNTPTSRPEKIRDYNARAEYWLNNHFAFYISPFFLNGSRMSTIQELNGKLYPISDACNKTGDPLEGCIYTYSYYKKMDIKRSSDSVDAIIVNSGSSTVVEIHEPTTHTELLNRADLRCSSDTDCSVACFDKNGQWDVESSICNITTYLHAICYRLKETDASFALDDTDYVSIAANGCFASYDWKSALYSAKEANDTITVMLRLNTDPVISASLFTSGCSDRYLANSTTAGCFGKAKNDQLKVVYVMFATGFFFVIVESIITAVICTTFVGKKRHIAVSRIMSPSYEQIFTPLTYAETHPIDLPEELAGLGTKGLHERLALNGTLRVPKPSFIDSNANIVEILAN